MVLYDKWQMAPNSIREAIVNLFDSIGIDFATELSAVFGKNTAAPQWITLREAATYANVSTFTVRRWCTTNKIAYRKLNQARCGRVLIKRDTLIAFIDSCKTDGRAA